MQFTSGHTEKVRVEVTHWASIQAGFDSNLSRDTGSPETFHGFSQSSQVNAGIIPCLGYDRCLPNPSQIIHWSSFHPALLVSMLKTSLDSPQ
jgi:hypothetical protein